jgi:tRNA1(Val) A37 N6-methylase TrmN6
MDESLDELMRGRLRLYQPRSGARVTADPLYLADFAAAARGARIVDLGCGTGILAIALTLARPRATAVGVEIVPRLAALARRNAALNGVEARLEIVEADLRAAPLAAESFELAVANPPYFAGEGRPAKGEERRLARAEIACRLDELLAAARRLLAPRGELCVIVPADRVAELCVGLDGVGLRPRALRFVHSVAGEPARRVLARAARDYRGAPEVLAPLVVHGADRRGYTPEAAAILDGARGPGR